MNSASFRETATQLMSHNFSVIPIGGKGKVPIVEWQPYQQKKPTTNEISEWSTKNLDLNIAVITGEISGITVIDIDSAEGEEEIAKLNLPPTYTVMTSKGRHLYYQYTSDPTIITSVKILPGIDIRNNGGYVIGEASTHESGWVYTAVDASTPIAPFPEAFISAVNGYEPAPSALPRSNSRTGKRPVALDPSARNSTLTSLAGSLRERKLPNHVIEQMVSLANTSLPDPLSDKEVQTLTASVLKYDTNEAVMHRLTELGVAERFCDKYRPVVRYNTTTGKWMEYNGKFWAVSEAGIYDRLRALIREIPSEVEESSDAYDTYDKFARSLESAKKFSSVLTFCKEFLSVKTTDFDIGNMVFNTPNATFDFKRGKFTNPSSDDMLTKCAGTQYSKDADSCPIWTSFLSRIFNNDQAMVDYTQRVCGYCLTGSTQEQVFFMLFGTGANGKSVFIDTLRYILGDYSLQANFATFLSRRGQTSSNDIASFAGKRLVCATESSESHTLDDALIKSLTGDGTITARFLYKEFFEIVPQCKIMLATNHRPTIKDDSIGMWRRLRLIPFTVTIPESERDAHLLSKLRSESPAILNWMIEGLKLWQANGLGVCPAVLDATEDYRDESDNIGAFIEENCIVDGHFGFKEPAATLYKAYAEWATENGDHPISGTAFGRRLIDRGHNRVRESKGKVYTTIRLNTDY